MRVHIHDVLARIAQVSGGYTGSDVAGAIEEYWLHFPYCIRLSITTDIEYTELNYLNRFGQGKTVYFSLVDYAHGRELAKELFTLILGREPDMSAYDGSRFNPEDKLYLFIHIDEVKQDGT